MPLDSWLSRSNLNKRLKTEDKLYVRENNKYIEFEDLSDDSIVAELPDPNLTWHAYRKRMNPSEIPPELTLGLRDLLQWRKASSQVVSTRSETYSSLCVLDDFAVASSTAGLSVFTCNDSGIQLQSKLKHKEPVRQVRATSDKRLVALTPTVVCSFDEHGTTTLHEDLDLLHMDTGEMNNLILLQGRDELKLLDSRLKSTQCMLIKDIPSSLNYRDINPLQKIILANETTAVSSFGSGIQYWDLRKPVKPIMKTLPNCGYITALTRAPDSRYTSAGIWAVDDLCQPMKFTTYGLNPAQTYGTGRTHSPYNMGAWSMSYYEGGPNSYPLIVFPGPKSMRIITDVSIANENHSMRGYVSGELGHYDYFNCPTSVECSNDTRAIWACSTDTVFCWRIEDSSSLSYNNNSLESHRPVIGNISSNVTALKRVHTKMQQPL